MISKQKPLEHDFNVNGNECAKCLQLLHVASISYEQWLERMKQLEVVRQEGEETT